ncbi:hypothetical protein I552_6444 [Mycobacterium xenopi 3993]|nr:hypothetical protein I552_6444 [Mycobacterium xenopi 3993]
MLHWQRPEHRVHRRTGERVPSRRSAPAAAFSIAVVCRAMSALVAGAFTFVGSVSLAVGLQVIPDNKPRPVSRVAHSTPRPHVAQAPAPPPTPMVTPVVQAPPTAAVAQPSPQPAVAPRTAEPQSLPEPAPPALRQMHRNNPSRRSRRRRNHPSAPESPSALD